MTMSLLHFVWVQLCERWAILSTRLEAVRTMRLSQAVIYRNNATHINLPSLMRIPSRLWTHCQGRQDVRWLVFINLTQARVILEEWTAVEKTPPLGPSLWESSCYIALNSNWWRRGRPGGCAPLGRCSKPVNSVMATALDAATWALALTPQDVGL